MTGELGNWGRRVGDGVINCAVYKVGYAEIGSGEKGCGKTAVC